MSYILNALRKSERERQAIEPETVTARIVAHKAPRHQSTNRLVAALIAINLAVLVYFLGFNEKTANEKTPTAATQPEPSVVQPEASRAEIKSPALHETRSQPPKAFPIAAIVEARSAAPVTPPPGKPAVATKQPIEPAKQALAPSPLPVTQHAESTAVPAVKSDAAKEQPIEPVKPVLAPQQPDIQKGEPAKDIIQKPEPTTATVPTPPVQAHAPVQPKNDLPFLDELPSEFGRSLPDLPINVFSYSSTPAERFVMIDMVKYTPGQRIKDQLELKEIRADSIVVTYNDRTFKIKRP